MRLIGKKNDMQEKHQHSGGFGNGFLLGMIVGGAIVFLLCTRMGRKILKELSENGISALNSIENLADSKKIQRVVDSENISGMADVVESVPVHANGSRSHEKEPSKRFFRGVRKRN